MRHERDRRRSDQETRACQVVRGLLLVAHDGARVTGNLGRRRRSSTASLVAALALAAVATGAIVARPARACPGPTDRYANVVNVGLTIGVSMIRRVKFTYGADIRFGHGPVIAWARVEGHGASYARFAAGVKGYHPGTRI